MLSHTSTACVKCLQSDVNKDRNPVRYPRRPGERQIVSERIDSASWGIQSYLTRAADAQISLDFFTYTLTLFTSRKVLGWQPIINVNRKYVSIWLYCLRTVRLLLRWIPRAKAFFGYINFNEYWKYSQPPRNTNAPRELSLSCPSVLLLLHTIHRIKPTHTRR